MDNIQIICNPRIKMLEEDGMYEYDGIKFGLNNIISYPDTYEQSHIKKEVFNTLCEKNLNTRQSWVQISKHGMLMEIDTEYFQGKNISFFVSINKSN